VRTLLGLLPLFAQTAHAQYDQMERTLRAIAEAQQQQAGTAFHTMLVYALIVGGIGLVIGFTLFGPLCRQLAESKGYNPDAWQLAGWLTGVIALVILRLAPERGKSCPRCGETIKTTATFCRFCQTDLPTIPLSQPAATVADDETVDAVRDDGLESRIDAASHGRRADSVGAYYVLALAIIVALLVFLLPL
jgi:hypothetical protein